MLADWLSVEAEELGARLLVDANDGRHNDAVGKVYSEWMGIFNWDIMEQATSNPASIRIQARSREARARIGRRRVTAVSPQAASLSGS